MKIYLYIISVGCIILAFVFGTYFGRGLDETFSDTQEPPRVFIEQLKTKLKVDKNRQDIEIFLDGERVEEDVTLEF